MIYDFCSSLFRIMDVLIETDGILFLILLYSICD